MSFSPTKLPFSAPFNGLTPQTTQQSLSVAWSAHPAQSGLSPSPFPRNSHTVTATTTGELFLFGSFNFNTCSATSDLYSFSTQDLSATLIQTSGAVPEPRFLHGAVLKDNTLLICGGTSSYFGDKNLPNPNSLYLLNLVSREWSRVVVAGPGPNGRHGHTTTVVDSMLFVFGGHIGTGHMNDMWRLDLNCLKSQPVWESYELTHGNKRPLPRMGHVSVVTKDRIIIFGGSDDRHYYNDTWSFNIATREWTELQCTGSIPPRRTHHAAVLVDDVMYVFGGQMQLIYFDELVALQLSTQRWFKFDNVGPSPLRRNGHAMTFDGTRVFVIGGDLLDLDPKSDRCSHIHVFDPKDIKYPDPEPNAVNPNGLTEIEQQLSVSLAARDQRIAQLTDEVADLQAGLRDVQSSQLSRDQIYEKELENMRAKFEANESRLVAVQSRLTDAEKDLAESKAEAVALRAQAATSLVNKDENRMPRLVMELMERVRVLEAGTAPKDWNEKSIESMECRNED